MALIAGLAAVRHEVMAHRIISTEHAASLVTGQFADKPTRGNV